MNYLLFIILLVIVFTGGYLLVNLLSPKMHYLEKISLGFLLFMGIFTVSWFVLNIKGIAFSKSSADLLAFGITLLFLLLNLFFKKINLRKLRCPKMPKFKDLSMLEKILISLILVLFLSSLAANLYWPVKDWDALALYDFRAMVFEKTGFTTDGTKLGYFYQYPFFTSLMHTFAYVNGIRNPLFFYTLIYTSFIACFYFALRRFLPRKNSIVWSFVLAVSSFFYGHSMMAYTNLSYSVFFVLAGIYFYIYTVSEENKNRGLVLISSLLLTFSMWTRYGEPFWMSVIFLGLTYLLAKKKFPEAAVFLIPFFGFRKIWTGYLSGLKIPGYVSSEASVYGGYLNYIFHFDFGRFGQILVYLYKNVFSSWGFLAVAFLLFVFLNFKKVFRIPSKNFLVFIIFNLCLLVAGTYLFSFSVSEWVAIPDSARRMSMFFIPLMIYYMGVTINGAYENKKKNSKK